jgi:hypothetical protein
MEGVYSISLSNIELIKIIEEFPAPGQSFCLSWLNLTAESVYIDPVQLAESVCINLAQLVGRYRNESTNALNIHVQTRG